MEHKSGPHLQWMLVNNPQSCHFFLRFTVNIFAPLCTILHGSGTYTCIPVQAHTVHDFLLTSALNDGGKCSHCIFKLTINQVNEPSHLICPI